MTLIAIGLDSAGPNLIEPWLDELPTFKMLMEKGAYGHLDNFDIFTAELPWTTFATGNLPEKTGYWTPLKYSTDYSIKTRAAYEYDEFPAFYALGDDYKVCSFDVPQVRLQKELHGLQINAWGAHSPQVDQESNQPEVLNEILSKYGEHPGLHKDYSLALDMQGVANVYDMLIDGIKLRGDVCVDLLQRDDWDLFLTVFGEPHGGGHNFWQFLDDHPLHNAEIEGRNLVPENPMLDTMKAIDKEIGRIIEAAPDDATVVVFSAHGMGPNTMDVPTGFFLPEFLYRFNFGKPALGDVPKQDSQVTKQDWGFWERHVWNTMSAGNPITKFIRKYLPTKLYWPLAPFLDDMTGKDLPMNPVQAEKAVSPCPSNQPAIWYSNLWPKMDAFALPSFSEGYIRINVKGREKNGTVDPKDYDKLLDELTQSISELKCARTGVKMARKIVRMRKDPLDTNPKLSDADLVIGWQEEYATDTVVHPEFGQIGPVPAFRGGSHRHVGTFFAMGNGIEAGSTIDDGHALDIGPTILNLLGLTQPKYMEGKPLELKQTQKQRFG